MKLKCPYCTLTSNEDWVIEPKGEPSYVLSHEARHKWACQPCLSSIEKERWIKQGIPKRYMSTTFDTYTCDSTVLKEKQEIIKGVCVEYTDKFSTGEPPNMLMVGKVGTGKTHLATCILKQILKGRYYSYIKLLNDVKATYGEDIAAATESSVVTPLVTSECSLLVLDDVGREQNTPWEKQLLCYILGARWDEYLPTILISNYTLPELEKRVTQGIYSRMTGVGNIILTSPWEDYRQRF